MVKVYCDICFEKIESDWNLEKGTTPRDLIKAKFFNAHGAERIQGELIKELDVCRGCYEKILNGGSEEENREGESPEELEKEEPEIESPAEQEKDSENEKSAEQEPEKEEPETVEKVKTPRKKEKKPRATDIDRGKIWALSHGKVPWTYKEIAAEVGCSVSAVGRIVREMETERGET